MIVDGLEVVPVPTFENYVGVTRCGKVYDFRLDRWRKQYNNGYGYLIVGLRGEGWKRNYLVHRLVLMTFKPRDDYYKLEGAHLDNDPGNANLNNLEWNTRSQNIQHCVRSGNHIIPRHIGEAHPRAKLTRSQVDEIKRRRANGEMLKDLALVFGCSLSTIGDIDKGRSWVAS